MCAKLSSSCGLIYINKLNEGEKVMAYSADGRLLASKKATGGSVHFQAKTGSVILLKIGNETITTIVK